MSINQMKIQGKYGEAIIYAKTIEKDVIEQVKRMLDQKFTKDLKIRIMPDCHKGAGCTIGTTMEIGEEICPNLVGVDIGCGILVVELGNIKVDFKKLDDVITKNIPLGFQINKEEEHLPRLNDLNIKLNENELLRAKKSIGTLGGGNHFIEIDEDEEQNKYLIIHSGSRNFGYNIASEYQKIAIENKKEVELPNDLATLKGKLAKQYLEDMIIAQEFASKNRERMANIILEKMDWDEKEKWETIHNYINIDEGILRKGAISAKKGEKILIPLNMRDGCLICVGKGNDEWNNSAPHGAGRIYSRTKARNKLDLDEFKKDMKGIYSTSINKKTLDESPRAYKNSKEIIEALDATCEILKHIKVIYNRKA